MFLNKKVLLPLSYYQENPLEASDFIYISKNDYAKITKDFVSTEIALFLKIFSSDQITKSTQNAVVRIGGFHLDDSKIIYAPQWVINQIQNGHSLNSACLKPNSLGPRVKLMQIYEAPVASFIRIQIENPEDIERLENLSLNGLKSLSVRDTYQKALQSYGGVEFNRVIPLQLQDDLIVPVKITAVEPLNFHGFVRFNGEVELDIEAKVEDFPESSESEILNSSSPISVPEVSKEITNPEEPEPIRVPTPTEIREKRLAFLSQF